MGSINELAQRAVKRIAEIWQVDSDRVVWFESAGEDLGFEWWPGDFRVTVRAQMPIEGMPDRQFRVVVRTDFLKDVAIESEHFEEWVAMMSAPATSTYAWVYPPRHVWNLQGETTDRPTLWFSNTAYIYEGTIEWWPDLLANTAIIQPINAQIQAQGMAELLRCGAPDTSRPVALRDAGLDGMLGVIGDVFAPLGQPSSRWIGTGEFEEFAATWAKSDQCFGMGDPTGLTLETPFGNDSALIELQTDKKHPQLGHGLLVTLWLPYPDARLAIARTAAYLNFAEATMWTNFHQFGCWHVRERRDQELLAFTLFMPNALYRPGLATECAFWFLLRARWVRANLYPDMQDVAMIDILERRYGGRVRGRLDA